MKQLINKKICQSINLLMFLRLWISVYKNSLFLQLILLLHTISSLFLKINFLRNYWNVFIFLLVSRVEVLIEFCKKCGGCVECGEKNFHRIFYKNSPPFYENSPHRFLWQIDVRNAVNAVNKKITAFHRNF